MAWAAPGPGRPKGSSNKRTEELREKLDALGFDPVEAMAKFALGEIPCIYCSQTGHAPEIRRQTTEDGWLEEVVQVICKACQGTGIEKIQPDLRAKMAQEVAPYIAPRLKSIEHQISGDLDMKMDVADRLMEKLIKELG